MISVVKLTTSVAQHLINKRLSRRQIEKKQLRKFRRLVRHSMKHSKFYRDIIESRQIDIRRCVPEDFPVLTKTDLMKNFDDIVTKKSINHHRVSQFIEQGHEPGELLDDEFIVVHTSGTSGEVGIFVFSSEEWTKGIAQSVRLHGLRFKKRKLAFLGATEGNFAGISFVNTGKVSVFQFLYEISCYDIKLPVEDIVAALNEYQPDIMIAYASGLRLLAEQQIAGNLDIHPGIVESSAEALSSRDEIQVEKAFGRPVGNVYSCSEHMFMGSSFPGHDGIVLFEDDLIFEFHDHATYVTNLFNYTEPLIRYRMDDVLLPLGLDTEYPFTRIGSVVGRMESAPVFVNEHGEKDFIKPEAIAEFFVEGLERFQFQVLAVDQFAFLAQLSDGLSENDRQRVLEVIDKHLDLVLAAKRMSNVKYDVRVVDSLHVDPRTGKYRLVVDLRNSADLNKRQ